MGSLLLVLFCHLMWIQFNVYGVGVVYVCVCERVCVCGVQTACMLVSGRYSLQLSTKHVHTCSVCHHNSSAHPRSMHELTVESFGFHDSDPEFRFMPRHCKACMESSWPGTLQHSCRKWKHCTWQTCHCSRFIVFVRHVAVMPVEAGRCFWHERAKLIYKLGSVIIRSCHNGGSSFRANRTW